MLLRSLDQIAHGELALAGLPAAVYVQAVGSEAGPRAVRATGTTTPQVKSVARQATTCHVGSQRPSGRRTGPGTELLAPTAWPPLPPPPARRWTGRWRWSSKTSLPGPGARRLGR
ncbi:hypothetical protein PVAP13_7KG227455 [Panicum virgatum]|uniref:Uncharacterized protein n=1 Tax=Panicum virgatum TaxID=38727 RepID=A0A8T0QGA9_PANVG|nr:hypothetical protein PVAP13_7KG227455 [Panicum virgatum]